MATKQEMSTRGYDFASATKTAYTATAGTTAAVVGCTEVLIYLTSAGWVTIGANPTAAADTAGNIYLNAYEKFHLQLKPTDKISAVRDTASGSLHVIPTTLNQGL